MLSQQHNLDLACASRGIVDPLHYALASPAYRHIDLLLGYSPATVRHQLCTAAHRSKGSSRTRDYGRRPSPQQCLPRQAKREVAARHMMCSATLPTTSSSTPAVQFPISGEDKDSTAFTFDVPVRSKMALSFAPLPSAPRLRKRGRAVADVDGEHSSLHKKKRRLRLFLNTSRLSPKYSHPATNIVDRGSSKIAVWAKQKALGRNLLRKAAILNRIRRRSLQAKEVDGGMGRSLVEQEREQQQLGLARLAFTYGSHDPHTRPVFQRGGAYNSSSAAGRIEGPLSLYGAADPGGAPALSSASSTSSSIEQDHLETSPPRSPNDAYFYPLPPAQIPRRNSFPLPPSPLGLSNYDAFDLEDNIPDPYAHLDSEDETEETLEENDWRSPSVSTSASLTSTLSTAPTGGIDALRTPTPLEMIYSDFGVLDSAEPVADSYDGVDDGPFCTWSNAHSSPHPRGDRAETSQSTTETIREGPRASYAAATCASPNFVPLYQTARRTDMESDTSILQVGWQRESPSSVADSGVTELEDIAKQERELQKERERQKSLMFLNFNA